MVVVILSDGNDDECSAVIKDEPYNDECQV